MIIDLITLFPEMASTLDFGVVGRARQSGRLTVNPVPIRDFTEDKHGRVDDRPYGGGPGMVMQYEPLAKAIRSTYESSELTTTVIYLSPQGKTLDQATLETLSKKPRLTLLCGRYEGIDERIIEDFVDEEYSIGDYVLSGGELPALVMIDGIARLLPEVLGHEASAAQDSFTDGLLDCPHYTRPEVINGHVVPDVLLSGDHTAIARWRHKQALGKTWQKRPDLIKRRVLSADEQRLLEEYISDAQRQEE